MRFCGHRTPIRITYVLIILAVAAGAYAWCFGFATIAVIEAQYTAKQAPVVKEVPTRLNDSAVTSSTGRKLGFCGYSLDVPWSDLNDSRTKSNPTKLVVYFESGLVLAATCSPPRTFVNTFLSAGKITPHEFRQIFGEEPLQSDYALTRLMLETTPNKISLGSDIKSASATLEMLMVKSIATPPAASGMFMVQTDEFEGFQYEDPTRHPKRVLVDLFAPDQSVEFIFLLNYEGASPHISQADINHVVQSVHGEGTHSQFTKTSFTGPN
jgi:hypothetical protein